MTLPDTAFSNPWDDASNAKPRDYEFFGQIMFDPWYGYFAGGGSKPIPFDPQQHPADKRTTIIEAQIIPISQQNVTNEVKQSFTDFSPDWTRIVLPSIKALGMNSIRDIHNKYVRVAMVEGKREIVKDGAKTGDFWKTWKFMEVFADEAACVAAYSGKGHSPASTEPQPEPAPINGNGNGHKPDKDTAVKFALLIVTQACKGKTVSDFNAIKQEIGSKFADMPIINEHFTVESPEIQNMIMVELSK